MWRLYHCTLSNTLHLVQGSCQWLLFLDKKREGWMLAVNALIPCDECALLATWSD